VKLRETFRYIDAHPHLHRHEPRKRELPLEVCRKIFNINARRFLGLAAPPGTGV